MLHLIIEKEFSRRMKGSVTVRHLRFAWEHARFFLGIFIGFSYRVCCTDIGTPSAFRHPPLE